MGGGGRTSVRSGSLQLTCEWNQCSQIFNDMGEFYQHLQNHFIQDIYDEKQGEIKSGQHHCKWELCEFVTNSSDDLLRHLYFHGYHTKVKWWGHCCSLEENVGRCYASAQNRNIIPDLPDGFKCEWEGCGLIWDIPDPFYLHVYEHAHSSEIETDGEGNEVYRCHWKDCSYTYTMKRGSKSSMAKFKLRDHLRTHTKERLFACPCCGNLYVNKTKFIDHVNRQADRKNHNYQCTHCSRTFATERLLKDHVRHHVNNYKCVYCDMTCPNPSAVRHHIKYKHSDVRPYKCQHCNYYAKSTYDLRIHTNFHQSNFAYECHVQGCEYKVRTLQNLRMHLRAKHNEVGTMWLCHVCDMKCTNGNSLTIHLTNKHNFKWPPGHSRFKYTLGKDGHYRLQTFRFESVNLAKNLYPEVDSIDRPSSSHPSAGGRSRAQTRSFIRRNLMKGEPREITFVENNFQAEQYAKEDNDVVNNVIQKKNAKRSMLNFEGDESSEAKKPRKTKAPIKRSESIEAVDQNIAHQPQPPPYSVTTVTPSPPTVTPLTATPSPVDLTPLGPTVQNQPERPPLEAVYDVINNVCGSMSPKNLEDSLVRREDGNPLTVSVAGKHYYIMRSNSDGKSTVTFGLASTKAVDARLALKQG